ncbi:MAG: hypothetical protein GDA56_01015 [Hormoscilla sp. GM7CHS1pb]|nr:hypothetical protein [Hormoscilla sp. GM7CHS1pb]
MELEEIKHALDDEGFSTLLEVESAKFAVDRLLIIGEITEIEQPLILELIYMPLAKQDLERIKLLQMFAALPMDRKEGTEGDLKDLILSLNSKLPLIGFGWQESQKMVYYRHVLALPEEGTSSDGATVVETVWMIFYLLETCCGAIKAVGKGEKTLAEAIAE